MAVKNTSDDKLIFDLIDNERVVLKYITDSCGPACEKLKPIFKNLSNDELYKGIKFLLINADNNPIALKLIQAKKQPIMSIYYKGYLLECRTVATKTKIKHLLDKLSTYVPTA